ncbi:glutathione S-transferase family protein [Luteithermobacter gelatinilyticus]|uniref:glutathione S-transferase family protein n=1 Tax=Luteithermobacter gelatinilyticus TaxID=2582913 RepID=UPI0011061A6D|nr:glutathione S-transferase family protein [Luteithermobacter gelatinilyticus]|tara:strand:+ start:3654 stop:4289 length:636 start_codon:yes stop_codon:yes gene_type:complete
MKLYYNPISSYCQKVLIAFYEKGLSFDPQTVDLRDKLAAANYRKVHPLGKLPLLITNQGRKIPESSIIIDYLDANYLTGCRLIPSDLEMARNARLKDRMYDLYLNDPTTTLLFELQKSPDKRDPTILLKSRETLNIMYDQMDRDLHDHSWANGQDFSLADCAAAPALFYAQRVHPFTHHPEIKAYFSRLMGRPSLQKVMGQAEPLIRGFFS